jgi:hypothetical protein
VTGLDWQKAARTDRISEYSAQGGRAWFTVVGPRPHETVSRSWRLFIDTGRTTRQQDPFPSFAGRFATLGAAQARAAAINTEREELP